MLWQIQVIIRLKQRNYINYFWMLRLQTKILILLFLLIIYSNLMTQMELFHLISGI